MKLPNFDPMSPDSSRSQPHLTASVLETGLVVCILDRMCLDTISKSTMKVRRFVCRRIVGEIRRGSVLIAQTRQPYNPLH